MTVIVVPSKLRTPIERGFYTLWSSVPPSLNAILRSAVNRLNFEPVNFNASKVGLSNFTPRAEIKKHENSF